MEKNQFLPNEISHKDLNELLCKAKKEILSTETFSTTEINENQEFDSLISDWTSISKKILLILNQKDHFSTKNRNSKSLIAFGAMGAHINMALQALKATEYDQ